MVWEVTSYLIDEASFGQYLYTIPIDPSTPKRCTCKAEHSLSKETLETPKNRHIMQKAEGPGLVPLDLELMVNMAYLKGLASFQLSHIPSISDS